MVKCTAHLWRAWLYFPIFIQLLWYLCFQTSFSTTDASNDQSKGQWTGTHNTNYSSDTGYSYSGFSDMKEAQFLQEQLSIIGAYVWLIDSLSSEEQCLVDSWRKTVKYGPWTPALITHYSLAFLCSTGRRFGVRLKFNGICAIREGINEDSKGRDTKC